MGKQRINDNNLEVDENGDLECVGNGFVGVLGELRMVDISRTNAILKTTLNSRRWAICDGTTPASQGITDPIITTTPDLRDKFIRMSNNETSGETGGAASQDLTLVSTTENENGGQPQILTIDGQASGTITINTVPPYYEVVMFIKVK
jgi:hypothetical protein